MPKPTTHEAPSCLLLTFTFTTHCARARFTDPAAPLVVCNAANGQSGVKALPDGSGGWFVFWMDKRVASDTNQVYGQRYDNDGYPQWTANGKAFLTPAGETVASSM